MKYNLKLWIKLNTIALDLILISVVYTFYNLPYLEFPYYSSWVINDLILSCFQDLAIMNIIFIPAGVEEWSIFTPTH